MRDSCREITERQRKGISMLILNLGCGTKTSNNPDVINIDWSIYLRVRKSALLRAGVPLFIRGERLERFKSLPDNIVVHNLAKGIPYNDGSVDAVYHSHLLEHLNREYVEGFFLEIKRVLKPGGIHRIVVPDWEQICRACIAHISTCEEDASEYGQHEEYIAKGLEQSVRREASGTSKQGPLRRFVENLVLGDARRRGETHQWMYDRINLKAKLINCGFKQVRVCEYNTSSFTNWTEYGLDVDEKGNQYKPGSLFIEAVKD